MKKREIKFRAWNTVVKFMITSEQIIGYEMDQFPIVGNDYRVSTDDEFIIRQYTGFQDKNGNEIYEGDILKYEKVRHGGRDVIDSVYADIDCGSWYLGSDLLAAVLLEQNNDEWKKERNYLINKAQYANIIGNIYENADFLTIKI